MTVLEVLHFPDKRLYKKAIAVETIDENTRNLMNNMLETMYKNNGIGLAATQINIQKRLVTIDLSEDRNEPLYLINPEILSLEGMQASQEGCLSVPGYYDEVMRAETITYRYQDMGDQLIESKASGLLAVCIQHEIDHLDGKLFINYLSQMKIDRLRKKLYNQKNLQAQVL